MLSSIMMRLSIFRGVPQHPEGATRSRPFDEPEQLGDRHGKRSRKALDVDQADVACATLDVRQVGAVDAGLVRKGFLRQAQLLAPDLDRKAEALADVSLGLPFFSLRRR